jgi:hypothetical protein
MKQETLGVDGSPDRSTCIKFFELSGPPECKDWITKLKGEKTEQSLESLGHLWAVTTVNERRAEVLVRIGFFQRVAQETIRLFGCHSYTGTHSK